MRTRRGTLLRATLPVSADDRTRCIYDQLQRTAVHLSPTHTMPFTAMLAGFLLPVFMALVIFALFRSRQSLPLPPGPKPKLITGNIHQLPRSYPWETYTRWAHEYGTDRRRD